MQRFNGFNIVTFCGLRLTASEPEARNLNPISQIVSRLFVFLEVIYEVSLFYTVDAVCIARRFVS